MLSLNTIMGTYRSGSLSPQSFAVPGREMVSRYYAMTDQEGQFEIGDIPPGTYKMVIWHPYLGSTKERTITIQTKIQAKGDIKIPAPTWPSTPTTWWTSPIPDSASPTMSRAALCRH
ncbi:MAG: hypothetical protein D4R81_09640 [Nitrospiraceae bacterium]|nr:MAG: hypothetical protein D4R81_09640 [Nitrospiraceae bacterium]